jgi:ubiquinone/menaquinone biosynthesis C-methylase UbiE
MNVTEHYQKLAEEYGASPKMSMKDLYTKNMEIQILLKYLKLYSSTKSTILEVGCGNGYTAETLSKELKTTIFGVDLCKELIDIAINRQCCGFGIDSATDLHIDSNSIDIVYTERCLINLLEPGMQEKAIDEIYRVLKVGGIYVMIECFTDGLDNLNNARKSVKMYSIPEPYHNKYFNKEWFLKYIRDKFKVVNTDQNFLSSYYWGSRVLYPALLKGDPEYNTKFVEFFTFMQPLGNYSYIQCYVLEKKKERVKG